MLRNFCNSKCIVKISDIKGAITQNAEPTADTNDFIAQNSSGGLNLVITNPQGNLLIKSSLSQSQGTLSPTLSSFIMQNRTGNVVAYVKNRNLQ